MISLASSWQAEVQRVTTTTPQQLEDAERAVAHLPPLCSQQVLAEFFGVRVWSIREWARQGRLTPIRTAHGGSARVRYARDEVQRLVLTMYAPA